MFRAFGTDPECDANSRESISSWIRNFSGSAVSLLDFTGHFWKSGCPDIPARFNAANKLPLYLWTYMSDSTMHNRNLKEQWYAFKKQLYSLRKTNRSVRCENTQNFINWPSNYIKWHSRPHSSKQIGPSLWVPCLWHQTKDSSRDSGTHFNMPDVSIFWPVLYCSTMHWT